MPPVSSAIKAVDLRQSPPPMIIGERVNAQGSKRAKRMVLAGDYDGLVDVARRQVEDGAHCIDICVAVTENDNEREFMTNLVKRLSQEVEAPLVIDSTDPEVVESAILHIPGRPIINSINLEGDGGRFAALAPIMEKYGVPAIAMCIGSGGMAMDAEQKLRVAEEMVARGGRYGLEESQYIFDPLTFTLATGQEDLLDSGAQTIEGIRLIKERFPDSNTVLGLSNVSFGLDPYPRKAINSVFLHHAVRAGLDCVIMNPRDIIAYPNIPSGHRDAAENLIFNRTPDALAALLADPMVSGQGGGPGASARDAVNPDWPAGRRANYRIINRLKDGIERDVVLAIADNMENPATHEAGGAIRIDMDPRDTHEAAIRVLNGSLLPAMKTVGDRFGAGELILPFVLKSAECMKAAVSELEKYLVKKDGASKGRLVLGTVYGDVHDIGKNLVKTILQNNGYTVYDLGRQVPLQKFLDKIEEVDADAVGLSALLVNTSREMKHFVDYAREHGMDIPILCGGAAINSNYINRLATDGGTYEPGMFYCRDIFDGLDKMDRIVTDRAGLLSEWRHTLEQVRPAAARGPVRGRSSVRPVRPPRVEVGVRTARVDFDEVWGLLDEKAVVTRAWGVQGKAASADAARGIRERYADMLRSMRKTAGSVFETRVTYGYFRCSAAGNALTIRNGGNDVRFDFPRSSKPSRLCLADYFGEDDVVALQAATVGPGAARACAELEASGRDTDSYFLSGLASEFVEALAEWTNRAIRREMGLDGGCERFSWGYGACPDVDQHRRVWSLLRPDRIGVRLTASSQISPDLSTVAMVVHHPDAKHFNL